jgi:hypothetical protein
VPPLAGPELGETPVTVGTVDVVNVNRSDEPVADVPPAVATVMSTVPAQWDGEVAVTCVAEFTVNAVAG